MISPLYPSSGRCGLTLLEVLVALGIFLTALVGISKLVTLAADQARDVQQQAQATQLCQAKLAEVAAGFVPLSGQSDVPFDEDSNWLWSLDAAQGDIAGLWKVTVRVTRQRPDGSRVECSLDRMLLDPSLRGSALDAALAAANSSSNSSSTSGSSSSSGAQGTSAGTGSASSSGSGGASSSTPKSGGSTAAPSSSGAAKPNATTGSTPAPSSSGSKGTTKGGN